jgi:cell division transport system permease protein
MLFILKEGLLGLTRSKFAGVVAMITVAISLILVGIFLIITVNLGRLVETLRNRVELEVFLPDSFTDDEINAMSKVITEMNGVEDILFISKDQAIAEFQSLFKDKKDDYFATLGYNPLPASFRVRLQPSFRNAEGAERVYQQLANLDGITDEDVVYRRELILKLEKYIKIAVAADFVIGIIVCLSALMLVSNNIRLIISSKKRIIETMKLVGATRLFIRIPLYIQGIIQGFFGGVIAALFLYSLLKLLSLEISGLMTVSWKLYLLLVNLGVLLGLSGSFTAVRRYL